MKGQTGPRNPAHTRTYDPRARRGGPRLSAYYGLSPPAAGLPGHRRLGKLRRGRHLRTVASRSKHPGPRNRADPVIMRKIIV